MKRSRPGPPFRAPSLHGQDRLFRCHFLHRLHERPWIPETLDVQYDDPRPLVLAVIPNDLRDRDITGVAVGGIQARSDPHLRESLVDHLSHAAAESDDRDEPRVGFGEREVAVGAHVGIRIDDPLAIRAEDPDAVLPGYGQAVLLDGCPFGADFGEATAVEDDKLDPFLPTIVNGLGHESGRDDHVYDIHISGNIQNRGIRFDAPDLIGLGIDGVDRPLESKIQQVLDNSVADVKFLGGCTDDCYCLGIEQRV